jgi:hypothetical protein
LLQSVSRGGGSKTGLKNGQKRVFKINDLLVNFGVLGDFAKKSEEIYVDFGGRRVG